MENKNNISDELLAAYHDGNTNEAETLKVLNAIIDEQSLEEVLDIALDLKEEESANVLPMMKLAAESGNNMFSAFILHRREVAFEEKELFAIDQKDHWLKPEGSPIHSIGQLLSHYDLMVPRNYDTTVKN